MILRALLTTALLAAAAHADFDRRIPTNAQPDLYLSTNAGRIHLYPGNDNEIHIKAHIYSNAGGDAQDRIRRISQNPPITQSGNTIHVGETDERSLYNNITIDYEISTPRLAALNLHSGSGDIEVDNLGRFLKADSGSGSVRAHGIAGPCDLHTGSGDIELQQQAPGEVRASSGSGSIRINGLAGGPLTLRSGNGDIEANGTLTGPAHVSTGSGSIRMHFGRDARFSVDATSGSGTIRIPGAGPAESHHLHSTIRGPGGPQIEARTGSGDIEID